MAILSILLVLLGCGIWAKAYMWQIDEMIYLICQQDEIECHVSGNPNKDEIFKAAENILK